MNELGFHEFELKGKKIEYGKMGSTEYFRVDGGKWMTRDEARELNITPSSLPTKNK